MKRILSTALSAFVSHLLFLTSSQLVADHIEVLKPDSNGCITVTFEGGGQGQQIHPETGGLIEDTPIRFLSALNSDWMTLIAGPFSNNPSGTTIAFWSGGASSAQVVFQQPVSSVGLSFASATDVTLEPFDESGNLLASETGLANFASGFNQWDPLGVDVGSDVITRVPFHGSTSQTAIDDFYIVSGEATRMASVM